jgi:hypothetical protein
LVDWITLLVLMPIAGLTLAWAVDGDSGAAAATTMAESTIVPVGELPPARVPKQVAAGSTSAAAVAARHSPGPAKLPSHPGAPAAGPGARTALAPTARVDVAGSTTAKAPASAVAVRPGYGCSEAEAYLASHAAPGFSVICPGYALGHQAMTCMDVAAVCPGTKIIAIADPCPAAYMNEASNSWVLSGLRKAPIDPYGYCR